MQAAAVWALGREDVASVTVRGYQMRPPPEKLMALNQATLYRRFAAKRLPITFYYATSRVPGGVRRKPCAPELVFSRGSFLGRTEWD